MTISPAKQPLTPPEPAIVSPDSDGNPTADNTKQFRWIVVIQQNLDWLFAKEPDVFVAGDLLWYPVQGNNKLCTAPDVMVSFGRPKSHCGSYKQWEEDNIAPQVVFEILSFATLWAGGTAFFGLCRNAAQANQAQQQLEQTTEQLEQTTEQLEQTTEQLEQERQRSQMLAARLRALGIDPDQI